MKAVHVFFAALAGILFFVIQVALFAAHATTIYWAWQISRSIIATVLTLVFPVIAQFWWAWRAWGMTGSFLNIFTLMILGVMALYIIQIIFVTIAAATEPKEKYE
ncbi:hypothetical protein [Aureimonas altamirensis]|uniref:hypothetical protein n=1 Tax=Aureimonas altamirensis TaxID=370622 RepID=UPI00301ADF71